MIAKTTRKFCAVVGFIFFIALITPAHAAIHLVRTVESPTLYYIDGEKSRRAFPNEATYKSWYGADFSDVITVSDEFVSRIPLGKNVTMKPGKYLVKMPSDSRVYAVEQGGVLRYIDDASVAEDLYGRDWEKKLIDLPEVFFQNYTLGDPIKKYYDVPDSIVYKLKNEKKYFWKIDNTLWPFDSLESVKANGYSLDDVVYGDSIYFERKTPVVGDDERVNNIMLGARTRNADCENKNLKAAFIFLSTSSADSYDEIQKIESIKKLYPDYYSWATREFSKVDVSYPTIILKDNGYFMSANENEGGTDISTEEVASAFYDEHPDAFDFLVIFGNFKVTNKEQAHFVPVTNRIEGVGMNLLESGEIYGSRGKLKGIIVMNDIKDYDLANAHGTNRVMNILVHEMLHQWSGAVKFINARGEVDSSLLRAPDLLHWSFYDGFLSPLGGGGWQDNKNGTFTSLTSLMDDSQKKPLADLDLYLMGLLPYQVVNPVYYIIPDNPLLSGNTLAATPTMVTIDQIISANGKWKCSL